jgi:regulator of nucleoside diphosphate kinase
MKQNNILITEQDMEDLRHILDPARRPLSKDPQLLETLEQELDRAQIVSPSQVPEDLVTMNSQVRLKDLDTGIDATYILVFPRNADFAQGRISVLAPIGTAILGYRVGDVIKWQVPAGKRRFRVEEVLYQPEAAATASAQDCRRNAERRSRRHREHMPGLQPVYPTI